LRDTGTLIKATTSVIDGEIVAWDQDGLPMFDAAGGNDSCRLA